MDTIFALSTPPGKSGVAVIRVSGPLAAGALQALSGIVPKPRKATLAALTDAEGALIDKALVLWFPAPHSFTGEDVVEFHVHGGRAVIRRVLESLGAMQGIRMAEPGEFSRRAFFSGKMDLTIAEGLADLIDAETEAQRKQAVRLMQGEAAKFYEMLRADALHSLAYMEAYIDFPDEEIPASVLAEINAEICAIAASIERQLGSEAAGEIIRDGVRAVILGPPNAGKSSLMNLLSGRDVAIVSDIAGTTRDVIEARLDIGGYCVVLSDTAGIREHEDALEAEGIRRSFARAAEADIRIVVLDAGAGGNGARDVEALITPDTIVLLNKSDVAPGLAPNSIRGVTPIAISVKEERGIEELLRELEARIAQACPPEISFVTRARHRDHLTHALRHLRACETMGDALPELRCEELRRAAGEIGKITGIIAIDELLGHIFSSFCIGK